MDKNKFNYMKLALKEAKKAYHKKEVPVGAIIVKNNKIIARAHNQKELKKDPTAHAEIIAIKKASKKLSQWRLNDCDLFVTLEPCPMCAGAILQSRIRKIYVGTYDIKSGSVKSVIRLLDIENYNHKVNYEFGILEKNARKF